jgi:1-deoxy-D-xylulose-5-phosphate reductoisomerase
MTSAVQQLVILGSTGSIGESTLDVVSRYPDRFQVFALTACRSVDKMFEQCLRFTPRYAVMIEQRAVDRLRTQLATAGSQTEVLCGSSCLEEVARAPEVTVVMAAIVGAAGLPASLAAAEAGKKILLANKEALVMAGSLFMAVARQHGAVLLPIDSEHNAIYQCLPASQQGLQSNYLQRGVRRVLLTASGGPFRTFALEALSEVRPEQACAHPNWQMGKKISVDSATMMNKGLELIEACWLFGLQEKDIDVVIHPQSVIHSMVEYVDGSVLAQLGNPDMRIPITYGLAWPERLDSGVASLDLITQARLDFEAADPERFPALRLARQAIRSGGTAPAILNAANEVAVDAFLNRRLGFARITEVVERVLQACTIQPQLLSLAQIQAADETARAAALTLVEGRNLDCVRMGQH